MLIEAGTMSENHTQEILEYKPTHVLIIDAAKMGLKPGESRLMNPDQLTNWSGLVHVFLTKTKEYPQFAEAVVSNIVEGCTGENTGSYV
jgi:Ni,Fe-hydrogenase maturation factor